MGWRPWIGGLRPRLSAFLSACAAACAAGACAKPAPAPAKADPAASVGPSVDLGAIARAEDQRRAKDIPPEAQRSHDPTARRAAARALARVLDLDDSRLLRALEDDDDEVVAWASYGLGESCKGREETHVRALASRLASLSAAAADGGSPTGSALQPAPVILRALGRCGGEAAELTLRTWLRREGIATGTAEQAAFALGDIASGRGALSLESATALLDAAEGTPPLDAALYPFARVDLPDGSPAAPRLVAAAKAALGRRGPSRVFALRALGRSKDAAAVRDLAGVLGSGDAPAPERVEAAHALGRLGEPGVAVLLDALGPLIPSDANGLSGDVFAVLSAALAAIPSEVPQGGEKPLLALAGLGPPSGASAPSAAILRRASSLRCGAAAKLARGVWDAERIRRCDLADGEEGEKARLAALDRGSWTGPRKAAWIELARSRSPRVREAALQAVSHHPELGDAALSLLAEALASAEAGVVATAAEEIHAHPERVYVLAAREKRAALDPRSPPPTSSPPRELDPRVEKALRAALARPWAPDRVETRTALLDASLALGLPEGRAYAQAACDDTNATVRARAAKALAAAGDRSATCPAPDRAGDPAPEIGRELVRPTRVTFETDAGASLAVVFDPRFAPVAATRFVALARSGFYAGIHVHRVVPGFVVQFGDPGADGYGGAGQTLRCETSPVPFDALDVGVALAGRDTGSSQLFVTLARHPHLDGEYAWVGRAEGDWDSVAEGDVIGGVRVEE